ncbi:hypothetical protein ISF_09346 [Cordyceps fumosorosea ARSEF 2679]|uniref:Rhodopsin domain-containing protein n=1 Tax=Cordyceps fumosorosea (strain ARSEF 2679) TaxID=1081104 RepID=A0A162JY65_CORFA|nr:hypothetical protein ISF_09346 [Cordyceps fumosorosea ARSEF 2679]OAA50728.1 hypothetical protein ISF_09346 [Cordyceps fumosorosea ARSEF 2679]
MAATQPAAVPDHAAAEAAFRKFTTELWTLYAVGLSSTMLRTYARIRAVGVRGLRPDDYFVWVGVLFYTAQTTLGYNVGHAAHGLANNGMTETQRASLDPNSDEYMRRVVGSKIQVAGWSTYVCLMTGLKISMLFFLARLMFGLGRSFQLRIFVGFILVIATFIACIVSIFVSCRPLQHYWAIYPNPGNIYLIMIPLPILWQSSLPLSKKIASTVVLGAGIFVLVCATLKSAFVLADPVNGAQLAGSWGTREAFVAVITTNLPMIFPLVKRWLRPLLPKQLSASQKLEKSPTGFRTIGGGGPGVGAEARRKPASANALTDFTTYNASEEHVAAEIKKEQQQHRAMVHLEEMTDLEASAGGHGHSPVLDAGDAEHEEWTQFQRVARD